MSSDLIERVARAKALLVSPTRDGYLDARIAEFDIGKPSFTYRDLAEILAALDRLASAAKDVPGSSDLLLLRTMLCLSGFAGEGVSVEGFEDPSDLYMDLAQTLHMEDADDADLRAHIAIEQSRLSAAPSPLSKDNGLSRI